MFKELIQVTLIIAVPNCVSLRKVAMQARLLNALGSFIFLSGLVMQKQFGARKI